MRKFLSALFSATVALSVMTPVAATAVEGTQKTDSTTKKPAVAQTTNEGSNKPTPTPSTNTTDTDKTTESETESADRSKRIDAYKKKMTEKLTQAQQKKLTSVCKSSQGKVTSFQDNLKSAVEKRQGHYKTINSKLQELETKLEAASIDTTELKSVMAEIDTKAAAIAQAAADYETALSDLSSMDCTTDPTGFKAALSAAREKRAAVLTQVQALKEYVNSTVKDLLKKLRAQLETKTDTNTNTTN